MKPLVSIVIPSYQNARYIEETVRSALAQTHEDLEVCIADHGSTDGTWERLQQFRDDSRVRLARTPSGGGAERNWNAVSEMARGDMVKLLCGDDLIAPDCVEEQVAVMRANPSVVLTSCRRDLIDVQGGVLLSSRGLGTLVGPVPGHQAIRALVRAGTNLLGEPGCVLVRRATLRAAGGWSPTFPYLIDQFSYMKVLTRGDFFGVDATLASFRVSNTQWSVRLAADQGAAAAGVHQYFREELPEVVSRWDERVGTSRAYRTAWARRLAYQVWRKRMQDPRR